jgi:hypothetical protein
MLCFKSYRGCCFVLILGLRSCWVDHLPVFALSQSYSHGWSMPNIF